MHELDRRPLGAGHPAIAPTRQRDDYGVEIASFRGQPILETTRAVLVRHPVEDAVLGELAQPVGETVARGAQVLLEILEAPYAEEGVAQYQQRPAVADHGERAGDRAGHVADVAPAHVGSIGSKLEPCQG